MKLGYIFVIVLLVFSVIVAGCAANMENAVTSRAGFDLECETKLIELVELGDRTYGVRGCGKRASYIISGGCGPLERCQAIMNSDSNNEVDSAQK